MPASSWSSSCVVALASVLHSDAVAGPGFLSLGRCRPVQDSRARADRHAHRRDGGALRPRRCDHPRAHPRQRDRQHRRQHRPALLGPESFLLDLGAYRARRCRHPGAVDARSTIPPRPTSNSSRSDWRAQYPGVTFYVLPVDIVTQILNFGLSAPIDIQIIGPNLYGNRALAERMLDEVRHTPGRRRCAHPAAVRLSEYDGERGPHARLGHRPDAAERGAKHAGRAQRQLPDRARISISTRATASPTTSPPRLRSTGSTRWPRCRACPITGRRLQHSRAWPRPTAAAATTAPGVAARRAGAWQPRHHRARRGTGHGEPLRRAAGDRYLHQRRTGPTWAR